MGATRMGLRPGEALVGAFSAPLSKSLAQRALVCASLCATATAIETSPFDGATGDDVRRALALIRACGAEVETLATGSLHVRGRAPGASRGWRPASALELGESGTLARLATAALGLCGDPDTTTELRAEGSLLARTSPALFRSLREAGVGIDHLGREHGWPARVRPIGPPSRLVLDAPSSSQEASGLLIAAAARPEKIEVRVRGSIPSRPYLEMTLGVLGRFSAVIESWRGPDGETFSVRGPLRAPSKGLAIEPDASAAAVLLAAACISGGEFHVPGLWADSLQGDRRIVEHLAAFGCSTGFDERGAFAAGEPRQGARLDLSGEPDLAPVLAAVAACAALRHGARSELTGLATLQGKESARISVLAEGLAALGLTVLGTETTLEIGPGRATTHALVLDPRGDHRMAFAFALLGLARDGVDVQDPGCVAKSWPGFWQDVARAGARVASDGE